MDSILLPAHAATTETDSEPSYEYLECVCEGQFYAGQRVKSLIERGGVAIGELGTVETGAPGGIPPAEDSVLGVIWDGDPKEGWGCDDLGSTCGNECTGDPGAYWVACTEVTALD